MMNVPNPSGRDKPAKPYPEFPLFPHASGRWAKKIRGRLHYFGPWRDPDRALAKYLADKDYLHAGRKPPAHRHGATIRDVLNEFLVAKDGKLESGEIGQRTRDDYEAVTDLMADHWANQLDRLVSDLTPGDFEQLRQFLAKGVGPTTLANRVTRARSVFKHAFGMRIIAEPVNWGEAFRKPTALARRLDRQAKGDLSFTARQIRRLVYLAPPQLRAMILLGINCGFGNEDCSSLTRDRLDLAAGWHSFPRPKTGQPRRCPLWPETVAAIQAAWEARGVPADASDACRVFLTARGRRWAKTHDRTLSKAFGRLLDLAGCRRRGVNFYSLRRTFETTGGADQAAIDAIMGHVPAASDMGARYRQRIDDERLEAVTDRVHRWLYRGLGVIDSRTLAERHEKRRSSTR